MLDREPFLKAIFAAPDDDLPRLVFADYLEEHGDPDWAELIRVQCEYARRLPDPSAPIAELLRREASLFHRYSEARDPSQPAGRLQDYFRGLSRVPYIEVSVADLSSGDDFRRRAVHRNPEWYGAIQLNVTGGTITTPAPLVTALTSPVTEYVTRLDLSGGTETVSEESVVLDDGEPLTLTDFVVKPAITVRMVEHLCQMREARRLTELDLRTNDLDNDALRALARSPHLIRLERLHLSDGNRFKGRVWQQVRDRFGPACVQ